jgi:hypothetical protein
MFIPDPDPGSGSSFFTHPGSWVKKILIHIKEL